MAGLGPNASRMPCDDFNFLFQLIYSADIVSKFENQYKFVQVSKNYIVNFVQILLGRSKH
jgi:hypothetical protein